MARPKKTGISTTGPIQSRRTDPVEHDGKLPAEERTGDVVADVRVSHRDHPSGRTVRIALRRGGTPVAITPDEAEALASELMDVAQRGR